MKIIITGAFGFLGSNVVQQCIHFGYKPIVLQRKESKTESLSGFDFVSIKYNNLDDIDLIESLRDLNPSCFIHIAWKGIDGSSRNSEEQLSYNLPFALKTVELAKQVSCKQWIGIGSLSEYGMVDHKIDEDQCPVPISVYGKSKLSICWASSALCQALGMKWSWIRVGSIFGPGDASHWLIPYVITSFLNGRIPELTSSEQVWDYLYVTDVADAILNIAKYQAEGIYNLGSGNGLTIREIVELIAEKIDPLIKPEFGAVPYQANQIMHMVANIEKITKATNWKPAMTFSKGIDNTLSHYQSMLQ